ncbi:DUF5753 domain-containing protein, partial [Nocardia gipuzkoensis]
LQTADYARVLIGWYDRSCNVSRENTDKRVALRLQRQKIITRRTRPTKLDVLLHESALHRLIGNRNIMCAQLHHLAEMSKRPNITIRLVPYAAGCPRGLLISPFIIYDLGAGSKQEPVAPPVVYIERGDVRDMFLHQKDDIQRFTELKSILQSLSLDEQQSRDLLRQSARSYER